MNFLVIKKSKVSMFTHTHTHTHTQLTDSSKKRE